MSKLTNDLGIGKRVRDIRRARKLTLQDVADGSGLAKSYVWEIENGKQINPSITTLISLTKALGTSLDSLVGLDAYMAPQLRPEAMQIAVQIDRLLREALREQS